VGESALKPLGEGALGGGRARGRARSGEGALGGRARSEEGALGGRARPEEGALGGGRASLSRQALGVVRRVRV